MVARFSDHSRRAISRILLAGGVLALVLATGATRSSAGIIDLGLAGQYAVFGLGSTTPLGTLGTGDTLLINTGEVFGSAAVGADTTGATRAGNGSFQKGFITGDLVVDTAATYTLVNKNFGVEGTVFGTNGATVCGNPAGCSGSPDTTGTGTANLVPAVQDAINRSAFYAGLPSTPLGNVSGSQTLAAGVYSATSFDENNAQTLTITGGPNDIFVLNDSGGFNFAKSTIVLTGGITADNVLFNVTGVDTSSAGTADISGAGIFQGTLLAVGRNIIVQDLGAGDPNTPGCASEGLCGRVIGSDFSNEELIIHSGAKITFDRTISTPEPSALLLLGTALAGLGFFCRRKWA